MTSILSLTRLNEPSHLTAGLGCCRRAGRPTLSNRAYGIEDNAGWHYRLGSRDSLRYLIRSKPIFSQKNLLHSP